MVTALAPRGMRPVDVLPEMARLNPVPPLIGIAKDVLYLPFDLARDQYASAVQAGLVERSLLSAARFERKLAVAEQATLGLWARRA